MTDLSEMNPRQLIAHYVLQIRAKGFILPYGDYSVIEKWLELSQQDSDRLLLVLSEILPSYFESCQDSRRPRSLAGIDKKVVRQLQQIKARNS